MLESNYTVHTYVFLHYMTAQCIKRNDCPKKYILFFICLF